MASIMFASSVILLLLQSAISSVSYEERKESSRDDSIFRKLQQLADDLSVNKKTATSGAMESLVVTKKNTCKCKGAKSASSSNTYYTRQRLKNGTIMYSLTRSTTTDYCNGDSQLNPVTPGDSNGDSQLNPVTPGYRIKYLSAEPLLLSVWIDWATPLFQPNNILAYVISYSVNSSRPVVDVSTSTHYLISDLKPNTVVSNVTVHATTIEGPGLSINLTNTTTIMNYSPKVQNISAEVLSTSTTIVSWDRLPIQLPHSYLVLYRQTGTNDNNDYFTHQVSTSDNSVVIRNLTRGVEYMFEVVAMVMRDDVMITGPSSDMVTVLIALPLSATNLQVRGAANNSVIAGLTTIIVILIVGIVLALLVLGLCWLTYKKKMNILKRTTGKRTWLTRQRAANWFSRQKQNWLSRKKTVKISSLEEDSLLETPHESSDTEQEGEVGVSIQFVGESAPKHSLNVQDASHSQ